MDDVTFDYHASCKDIVIDCYFVLEALESLGQSTQETKLLRSSYFIPCDLFRADLLCKYSPSLNRSISHQVSDVPCDDRFAKNLFKSGNGKRACGTAAY